MPTVFTHALAGGMVSGLSTLAGKQKRKLIILSLVAAVLPDLDAIGFKLKIPYDSAFGHRGFSHSILFALLSTVLIYLIFFLRARSTKKDSIRILLPLFISAISHPLLDALTNGGLGVAFFFPVSEQRYFFPFRPIEVAPIALRRLFSTWGMHTLLSEFLWIWLPLLIISFFKKKIHFRPVPAKSK